MARKQTQTTESTQATDAQAPAVISAEDVSAALSYMQGALTERAHNKPEHYADLCKERDRFNAAIVSALLTLGVDCKAVADNMRSHDARMGTSFCALYAVTKVRAIAQALALNSMAPLDPHTQTILLNNRRLNNMLTAKSALVVQSRSIEYTATDTQQAIKRYGAKYTAGTASTQRSSTREALRVLGMAPLHKGHRDDPIVLHAPESNKAVERLHSILDAQLSKETATA